MTKTPFKLIHDSTLQFLFLFTNADGFYITSRYALQHGWIAAGCSNMHQAIELYIKAILKLNYEQEIGHDLVKILRKYKNRDSYFTEILQNPEFVELLEQLSTAYLTYRYGEAGASSNSKEIIEMLDEIAFNLRNIYLKNIKSPSNKIYIPMEVRTNFLKDNQFFTEANLTNNPLAQMGLPIGDELFDDKKML
ncbi:MAG: HEPN domain-containing protein [bacterium]|nr:HEPN domain-containing protein [bacterium]